MTIILFLIDTSASMNQRAYLGGRPTLLDVAKGAVETFLKIRQRDPVSRGDRYMLLTFEEPPANIKAGWKENHATFMNELKNLQATGLTNLGSGLKNSFDVLNINRMQTGIDTYGQGRCPFYLEPSVIVVITDGGQLSTPQGIQAEHLSMKRPGTYTRNAVAAAMCEPAMEMQPELQLNMHPNIPGSELTREPFRWDQRLFSLVLRLGGTPALERDTTSMVPSDHSPIDAMCEVTGGRSYAVTSQRMLVQCLESLVQKVQSGVVIHFEKTGPDPPLLADAVGTKPGDGVGPDPVLNGDDALIKGSSDSTDEKLDVPTSKILMNQNGTVSRPLSPSIPLANSTSWHTCRKLIYVQRSAQKGYSVGHWPIPEAFWPDVNSPALPPRAAHPVVKFMCTNSEPMVIDNLPFDKYELEPSPLTQFILSRRQPTTCWQVYVSNSYKNSELGYPFGYLKASTNLTCVNLFVMPYNYPVLLPLLDDLFKVHRLKPTREWRQQFDSYLKNMPLYYAGPLKRALQRMGAPNLVPDNMENCLSYSVLNYLKRLKNQAKSEFEKLVASVSVARPLGPDGIRVVPRSALRRDFMVTSNPALTERFSALKEQINDFSGFMLGIKDKEVQTQSYRNPFDISRRSLLDQIARMRANYLQMSLSHTRLQDDDQLHNMPVGQMGNYQEYLKRMPQPLREIESAPVRQHMFGNPFKIDKRMMVDEADIDLVSGSPHGRSSKRSMQIDSPPGSPRSNKRKPGPLPRDIPIRRPQSPMTTASLQNTDLKADGKAGTIVNGTGSEIESNHIGALTSTSLSSELLTNHIGEDRLLCSPLGSDECSSLKRPAGTLLNHCQEESHKQENARLKVLLYKELRKPGRNFTQLFTQLNMVQGPLDVRIQVVRDVIHEALRFKRKFLVQLLEDFEQSILQEEGCNHKLTSPSR